jgi:archaellum component FlaC
MSNETIALGTTFVLFFVTQLLLILRSLGGVRAGVTGAKTEIKALETRVERIEKALEAAREEYVTRLECAATHQASEKYMGALMGKIEVQIAALAAQIADLKVMVNKALNQ